MWNKRKEEERPKTYTPPPPPPAPVPAAVPKPVAASPVEPKKEPSNMSMPARFEPDPKSASSATIGKAVKINGQIHSKEDLFVDGDVEGTVEAPDHKLTIGPNGTVHATIKAREVVALGTIQGNVEAADKIEIRKEARLVGDIRTARIIIEDGAYFKGSIDIVKQEPKAAPKPQVAAAPSVAAPAAAAAQEIKR
jgi:cytoskeletal protein CcmA (bactofilin family)